MIIKSYRVRTRGGAKRKLLDHLMHSEGNEEVSLVCGTLHDIDDAFADARRLGREYSLRHWIVAPSRAVADDELLSTVALLAQEFNAGSSRPVVFRHWKGQVHGSAPSNTADRHLHVLMPEVDPVTNSVLSNSNNFARHEKLSRILEAAWGHPFTAGAHNTAVIKALRAEGNETLAAALEATFAGATERTRQAFESRDHQRLKREGYDLPALRLMISEAWTAKASHTDFIAKLADHHLSVKPRLKSRRATQDKVHVHTPHMDHHTRCLIILSILEAYRSPRLQSFPPKSRCRGRGRKLSVRFPRRLWCECRPRKWLVRIAIELRTCPMTYPNPDLPMARGFYAVKSVLTTG